jgi:hemerythrin superfamily protein
MTEHSYLIDVLVHDHSALEDIFGELESGQPDPVRQRHLVDRAIADLTRHTADEERHLYPLARRALPGGDALVARELEEHGAIADVMGQLDGLDPADPEFDALVAQLIADVRGHVADEETDLFPRLQAVLTEDELGELGAKVLAGRQP